MYAQINLNKNSKHKNGYKITIYLINIKREKNQRRMAGERRKEWREKDGRRKRRKGRERGTLMTKKGPSLFIIMHPVANMDYYLFNQAIVFQTLIYGLFFNRYLDSKINKYTLFALKKFIY